MDQITVDINSTEAQECLDTAKKLIQNRIKDLTPDRQIQLSGIYSLLTIENAKEYLATVRQILCEIREQHMRDRGIMYSKIALGFGCGTLFSCLFCKITGIGSKNIPIITIGGGFATLLFVWFGLSSYFNIQF